MGGGLDETIPTEKLKVRQLVAWRSGSCFDVEVQPVRIRTRGPAEVGKVTWPTWKEVWITTVMVLIMVSLRSCSFLLVDQVLGRLVKSCSGSAPDRPSIPRAYGKQETNLTMAKRWYIVHAYTNFERKVADAIKERAKSAASSTSSTKS